MSERPGTYCEVCMEDWGEESHYHCNRCEGQTSMMGHSTNVCKKYTLSVEPGFKKGRQTAIHGGPSLPRHMCCPGDCQFDHPEEFEADLEMWRVLGVRNNRDYSTMMREPIMALEFIKNVLPKALTRD